MTKLSVNINKFATLRNARGGNNPDIIQVAKDCEDFGADGITVHPRPDGRHIRFKDVFDLKPLLRTEFNIEGNPTREFLDLVMQIKPEQCTLVPDAPIAITSNAGWDTLKNRSFLTEVLAELRSAGTRTSLFVDPDVKMVEGALSCGADRIELYTEPYAIGFPNDRFTAVNAFTTAALAATSLGLGVNAGHDLDLDNLRFFHQHVPGLLEVSIGHALVCDAIYLGLENTIRMYKGCFSQA